jgi:CubicO group peptidase (beta-lactamase class C family)
MASDIGGTCSERFKGVQDVLASNLESGADLGASLSITVEGETVVDIWGGWSDPERTRPWEADTITNVWSTTKTMTALCALLLVDAGEIDLDAPVSRYWPEFASGGKADRVLVRHIMAHTSGLAGWSEPMATEDLYDWDKATSLLAAQEPFWEPGTASGYHAVTQGYLVGEVIRRVTGQTVGEFLAQNVTGPLGADFHIGLDPAEFGRVSNVVPPPPFEAQDGLVITEMAMRVLGNPFLAAESSWTDAWRQAQIPAANGHGNARSVARVQAVIANGGELDGRRFLSEATCARILEEQANGTDLILGAPIRFGIGFGLSSPDLPLPLGPRACFWGGWGGSVILVDMEARTTLAYMMNRMDAGLVGDTRGFALAAAFSEAMSS